MLRYTIWLAGQSQLRNESAALSVSDEQRPPERTRRSCLPGSLPSEPGEGSPEKVRPVSGTPQQCRVCRFAASLAQRHHPHELPELLKQREIRSDADLDGMADFFESTLAGIRMAAKAGKSRHALRNIAAYASRAYMASDR